MIGASSKCFHLNVERFLAGNVVSQNLEVSLSCNTKKCQPCVLPAEGARDARSTIRSINSGATGSLRKDRTILRERTQSANCTAELLVFAELQKIFGHCPAVHHEHASLLCRNSLKHCINIRRSLTWFKRFEIHKSALAIALDHK